MSFSIVFTKGADKDISESMQWYELQKKGLGKRFFDKLYEKVEKIEKESPSIRNKVQQYQMCID